MFELQSRRIAVGDPVMGLRKYDVKLKAGLYSLEKGCLVKAKGFRQESRISLDSVYLYVLDATHEERFTAWFHQMGNACSYNMTEMQNRHRELEEMLGVRVGFYWTGELSDGWEEGEYVLDLSKINLKA
jgi:hypothetical protein